MGNKNYFYQMKNEKYIPPEPFKRILEIEFVMVK
jgi:hypothetical protein